MTVIVLIVILVKLVLAIHWSTSLVGVTQGLSWWRRNRQATVTSALFVVAGVVLIVALANDCRYTCDQWQSTALDIFATLASFLMGMILTRAVDLGKEPLNKVAQTAILFVILPAFATTVILSPLGSAPNSAALFIWALALPVLGSAGKRLWPWLF